MDLLQRLEREHVEQLRQFQAHQEYLVMRDPGRALEVLVNFEDRLVNHMELEERYLLPLCEPDVERPGHWGPRVYALEHKRIRALLASVRMRLAAQCVKSGGVLIAADVVDLLDEETSLKHLLSHHQTREATALYPGVFGRASEQKG